MIAESLRKVKCCVKQTAFSAARRQMEETMPSGKYLDASCKDEESILELLAAEVRRSGALKACGDEKLEPNGGLQRDLGDLWPKMEICGALFLHTAR